ncbi:MAG: M48 family metallopeptidase [Chromatiaceae bacterium]|nr:M48 family metallopeptidase [Chromatiaceae bacterium]
MAAGTVLIAVAALAGLFGWGSGADDCAAREHQGAAAMQRIQAEWPLRGSGDSVTEYVQDLGERLVRQAGLGGGDRWQFHVVRNLAPNAFAVGGGRFVVTDGLFALVRNEAELAAVLAHEIAHEKAGHFCRRRPASGQQFQVGSLTQHFDAEAEAEADEIAVHILRRAGFDPSAMEVVLRCIAEESSGGGRRALDARIARLARQSVGVESGRRADSPAFTAARHEVGVDLGLTSGGSGAEPGRACR